MKRKRLSRKNGDETARVFSMDGSDFSTARGKYVRPNARIRKDMIVRAARMADPDFFSSLKGDDRKIAILTLERGFLPILRNCHAATDAICEMCKETKGKRYNPVVCIRKCRMFKAVEMMERLAPLLGDVLATFHRKGGNGEGDGGPGPRRSGPEGDGDGREDKGCLVPA